MTPAISQDSAPRIEAGFRPKRRRLAWFLAPLIAGPLLIVVSAFFVVPTQWFARHVNDPWLRGLGYGADFKNVNCQIVLYGDSTAELGLDPQIIQQRTGMSACNIAEEAGLIRLDGNFVLDEYLRKNSPPKVLVMVFGSEVFNTKGRSRYPIFEPITYEMGQHHKLDSIWRIIAQNPEDFFRWTYKGVHMAGRFAFSTPVSMELMHEREHTGGRLTINDLRMVTCSDSRDNPAPDRAWIEGLRSRYSRPGTVMLLDVMPLPECDPGLNTVTRQFSGLIDAPVKQLANHYYYREGRHVDPSGAAEFSQIIADQILQRTMPEGSSSVQAAR